MIVVVVESIPFCFCVPRPALRPKMKSAESDIFGKVVVIAVVLMPDKAKPSHLCGEDIMAIIVMYKDTKGNTVENVMVIFCFCFLDLEEVILFFFNEELNYVTRKGTASSNMLVRIILLYVENAASF